MASKISINLDTSKENYLVSKCKQNDDLVLEAFIHDKGLELDLTNKEITIQALKADNTYIIQNTDIVKENNKIIANLVKDFTRVPGETKIEIVLVASSKQNTTFSFTLEVVGSVIRGAVQSGNTVTILEVLDNKIELARQVKEETKQLIENGGAATTGQVKELNASLEHNAKVVGLTDEDVNIYVNCDIGNDTTGNGTIDNPYKTIQRAFDSIPKVINNRHTVFCAPGTYDEEPYLSGVIGGSIYVMSYGDKPDVNEDISCRVKAVRFYDIMGYVHIEDFGQINYTMETRSFMLFSRCIYGSVSRCRFDINLLNTTKRTIEWDGSNGSVGTSYFGNQFICIYSQNGSSVRVDFNNTIGEQCNRALYADGGHIAKNGDVAWHVDKSNYPETKVNGGQILGRPIYEWKNSVYENDWETSGSIPLKYRIEGNLCILTGWIKKDTLDTTKITTMPVGYRPIVTQRHKLTMGGTSAVQSSEPVLNISPNGTVNLVNSGNVTSNILVINVIYPIA